MEKILSLQNAKVKKLCRLHKKKDRDESGLFLVEGDHLIEEADKAGCLQYVISDEEDKCGKNGLYVTPEIMKKISCNVSEVHRIGLCRKLKNQCKVMKRVLILDGVQDPGNLGTLVRTAVSFSFDAVYCSKDTVDLYNEKTVRSTQGAMFHIPVIYGDLTNAVQMLKTDGFRIIATSLHDAHGMSDVQSCDKMAFIFGNEGQGVSKAMLKESDERLFIEMNGFESLNVAVAGGIVMYAFRQK